MKAPDIYTDIYEKQSHPFIPINTMVTESVYLPTDPLLETQTIPTFPKMQPQPQIIDSTPSLIVLT